jgi:regulatory subunit for Cdc7p protein kinase
MAQVSIPPSPAAMSRRAPLSNLPNEVNSNPYSSITAAAAKRQRSLSTAQRETTYGQQPPQKKQIVEVLRTPVRNSNADSKVNPSRRQAVRTRTNAGTPPAYNGVGNNNNQQIQRKAVAKTFTDQQNSLESVRAWQRHYRRMFPSYVFYFESLPDDVAAKFQKQIQSLGAVCYLLASPWATPL